MSTRIGFALLAAMATAPALAEKPQIQWNTAYDFSAIKTFQWRDHAGESLKAANPFLHGHLINAIEYQLTAHGLTEATDDNPDVFVNYTASMQRDVRLESDAYGYTFGGYGYSWGRWGYGYGYPATPASTTTRVVEVKSGTLVVDIWDASSSSGAAPRPTSTWRTIRTRLAAMPRRPSRRWQSRRSASASNSSRRPLAPYPPGP